MAGENTREAKNGRRLLFSALLKALVLALALAGQYLGFSRANFMAGRHFLYYTYISNILAGLLMLPLLFFAVQSMRAGSEQALPRWLNGLRFAVSAGILLTFAGFSLLLLPLMDKAYLLSPDNLLVHNLVPLLACLDYALFAQAPPFGKRGIFLGLALPLLYLVFAIILIEGGTRFHGGSAPYFFMDYKQNGWFSAGDGKLGAFWWMLILLALQLFLSRLLEGFRALVANNRRAV